MFIQNAKTDVRLKYWLVDCSTENDYPFDVQDECENFSIGNIHLNSLKDGDFTISLEHHVEGEHNCYMIFHDYISDDSNPIKNVHAIYNKYADGTFDVDVNIDGGNVEDVDKIIREMDKYFYETIPAHVKAFIKITIREI